MNRHFFENIVKHDVSKVYNSERKEFFKFWDEVEHCGKLRIQWNYIGLCDATDEELSNLYDFLCDK